MDTLTRTTNDTADGRIDEVLREQRRILASLREALAVTRRLHEDFRDFVRQRSDEAGAPLLTMAEGLVAAHRAAKSDGDGHTLDLIEDALFYVGKRLRTEWPGDLTAALTRKM